MLPGGYTAVLQARSREEFRDEVVRFTQQLGFETVSAVTMIDHGLGKSDLITVDNTPTNYVEPYVDAASGKRDPVLQHCKRQTVPIIWNQNTYVENGVGDLWEQQAQFGYRTGIAMALHLPDGKHFLLGVDRDQPLPADPNELQRVVADLQLFAVHAQEAAMRLLVPPALAARAPGADATRAGGPALDHGRQDRLGSGCGAGHQRAHGRAAHQQRHAQAGLRQQAPGGAEGACGWASSTERPAYAGRMTAHLIPHDQGLAAPVRSDSIAFGRAAAPMLASV